MNATVAESGGFIGILNEDHAFSLYLGGPLDDGDGVGCGLSGYPDEVQPAVVLRSQHVQGFVQRLMLHMRQLGQESDG